MEQNWETLGNHNATQQMRRIDGQQQAD